MELKKCPFCKGKAYVDYKVVKHMYIEYFVKCKKCGGRGGSSMKREDAEKLWNKR